jgi:hypothetical protein
MPDKVADLGLKISFEWQTTYFLYIVARDPTGLLALYIITTLHLSKT